MREIKDVQIDPLQPKKLCFVFSAFFVPMPGLAFFAFSPQMKKKMETDFKKCGEIFFSSFCCVNEQVILSSVSYLVYFNKH